MGGPVGAAVLPALWLVNQGSEAGVVQPGGRQSELRSRLLLLRWRLR